MYFFIFVFVIYALAKIFSKKFRQLNIDNIHFFKSNIEDDYV
jgi:hypothetical protein